MSLGSESAIFETNSLQNSRVLERLVDDSYDMTKKLEKMGMPLDMIKEELFIKPLSPVPRMRSPQNRKRSPSPLRPHRRGDSRKNL